MDPRTRARLRLAGWLQTLWPACTPTIGNDAAWRQAAEAWHEVIRLQRLLHLADQHDFSYCLDTLRADLRWQLDRLAQALPALRRSVGPIGRPPNLADWVHELDALEAEFGRFETGERGMVLRVVTEPVTLEGIALGPFAVELVLARLGRDPGPSCFRIVALDSNPAVGREEVTHPHVSGEELCAGDATVPIQRALADGRLADAFVLVRSVLSTYHGGSAHVALDVWDGLSCGDCGDRADRAETGRCGACECDLCDRCQSSCRSCGATRCRGCLVDCDGCDDPCCDLCLELVRSGASFCPACRATCHQCRAVVVPADLDDDGRCADCQESVPRPPDPPEAAHAA